MPHTLSIIRDQNGNTLATDLATYLNGYWLEFRPGTGSFGTFDPTWHATLAECESAFRDNCEYVSRYGDASEASAWIACPCKDDFDLGYAMPYLEHPDYTIHRGPRGGLIRQGA